MQNNALCQARNRVFNAALSLQLFWRFSSKGVCKETTVSSFLKEYGAKALIRRVAQRGPSGSFEGFNANLGVFEKFGFWRVVFSFDHTLCKTLVDLFTFFFLPTLKTKLWILSDFDAEQCGFKRFLKWVCEETTVSSFLQRTWCESTLLLRDFHSRRTEFQDFFKSHCRSNCAESLQFLETPRLRKAPCMAQTSEALKRECLSTLSSDRRGRRRCKC